MVQALEAGAGIGDPSSRIEALLAADCPLAKKSAAATCKSFILQCLEIPRHICSGTRCWTDPCSFLSGLWKNYFVVCIWTLKHCYSYILGSFIWMPVKIYGLLKKKPASIYIICRQTVKKKKISGYSSIVRN